MTNPIFNLTKSKIQENELQIISSDENRPWGGFFVIDESQAQKFADTYFNGLDISQLKLSGKLSPKILMVAPNKRLSWQYHLRRAEIWRVIEGKVGISRSNDDNEGEIEYLKEGDFVTLKQGERHRLIGLSDWSIIAEIWQHTDKDYPSDENDIIRIQDDFSR